MKKAFFHPAAKIAVVILLAWLAINLKACGQSIVYQESDSTIVIQQLNEYGQKETFRIYYSPKLSSADSLATTCLPIREEWMRCIPAPKENGNGTATYMGKHDWKIITGPRGGRYIEVEPGKKKYL